MQKTEAIADLFREIAPHYDRMNRLMTFGQDLRWREKAVRLLAPLQPQRLLDLAAGTGDFARIAAQALPSLREVVLFDLVPEMLQRARAPKRSNLVWRTVVGNAHALPFEANYFDAITVGFGVRNFEDRLQALREMHRVLRTGGLAIILETGLPTHPLWKGLFWLYFRLYVPLLGALVARAPQAYVYLPQSTKAFPHREKFLYLCQEAGFSKSSYLNLMGGAAILYKLSKT